ncbi:helix-turn-helix domain-containing protein [Nocardioides sp. CER19]|uniref:ArsR/SmtB family transcription factor n=1 Tax=Nocardioides sp. CER19 TaxID=3038538 RepID=UPI00244C34EC|nr:helix-turn-helix domain-containing protein [Nocardioides sp. CER19]MDH2415826.1 helix-turn-helix domain-containing protein [Nocardioides sp. CER19]
MRDGGPGDVRQIDDVRALAALGNPDRVRLLDALAVGGPASTSALADALDLATGSISHHLKVLSEAGLVRPAAADDADRRVRRWELASRGTRWNPGQFRGQPAEEAAVVSAQGVYLARQFDQARAFLEQQEPPWDDAAYAGHFWLRLTPDELVELGRELNDLLLRWRRREVPDDGGEQRTTVLAIARAFPAEP